MYILVFTCLLKVATASVVINTDSGPVRGVTSLVEDVEAYLGIPYAEPPIGELRFSKPVPKKKWLDVYNATNLPPPCAQISLVEPYYFMPNVTNMSEDCLYLNVWAPKSKSTYGLRPVIVFIHPGGFLTGSSNLKAHDGSHLANRGDLVVVTINYRLGPFGFFLAYAEEADGNMGIYDQLMAINWVRKNAKFFNGDPENIVLMGSSAGAMAISTFILSPLSKDLFKRAIILGGTMLHPFFTDDNARLFKNSKIVASLAGCSNETVTLESDPSSVVKCLKASSVEDLLITQRVLSLVNPLTLFPKIKSEFLPKNPIDLVREGNFRKDIDILFGVAENEGTLFLLIGGPDYLGPYGKKVKVVKKSRALTLSKVATYISGQTDPSRIIDYYMSHIKNRTTSGYLKMVSNILGDFSSFCSTVHYADHVSLKGNSVYFYKFGFRAASTPMAEWVGTTHIDDLQYIFGSPYHDNFTDEELALSHRMIDRWSAFARTGNPNIPGHLPWLRYSYHTPVYLNIGQDEESIRLKPNDRCEFWRKRFKLDIDAQLVRFLRNSGMNITST